MTPAVAVNAHRRPEHVPPPAGAQVQCFHAALPGYRPTPLRTLDDLAVELGVRRLWLKDESERLGLPAFKILGASWAVERTVRAHPATHTVVAASAGNHGRAVARVAATRGLGCRIHLPAATAPGRAGLIAGEGAEVVLVDRDYDAAVAQAEQDAARPGVALVADTALLPGDGPPEWAIEGYSTLFHEVGAQLPEPVDLVLVPTGVGSLTAAAVRWAVRDHPGAAVVAVEAATAPCVTAALHEGGMTTVETARTGMAGLDCATPSAVALPTLLHGLMGALAVDDAATHRAMRELAARGLTIGDCGAAPLAALRRLLTDPACAELRDALGPRATGSVLCVATEGASDPDGYAAVVT